MPELPEVETVRAGLEKNVVGKKIIQASQFHIRALRKDSIAPLSNLKNAKIKAVKRRGKFMWLEFDRPEVLVAHLGMSGQFKIENNNADFETHLRANFQLSRGLQLRFIDQRTFGWLCIDQLVGDVPSIVSHIARDLFDDKFDMELTANNILHKRAQIKKVILDQSVLSGIGNIYADEALWRARIHPERIAMELSKREVTNLIKAAKTVMERALAVGGTSFDQLYVNVNGESGYFERSLAVYGREGEPCRRMRSCGGEIIRIAFANRSSRLCPACQTR